MWLSSGPRAAPSGGYARAAPQQHALEDVVAVESIRLGVFDDSGAPIRGLAAADFIVREDGVERQILSVEGGVDTALDVVLVLDRSYSMMNVRWQGLAVELLQRLSPQRDCVLLVRFDQEVSTSAWRRPDDPSLVGTMEEAPEIGGTSLLGALTESMRQLFSSGSAPAVDAPATARTPGGSREVDAASPDTRCAARGTRGLPASSASRRRAIIAITDGADTSSTRLEADRLEMAVQAIRAPIFHLAVEGSSARPAPPAALRGVILDFEKLIVDSGGATFQARYEPYERLLNHLRFYYDIRYRIPPAAAQAGRFEFESHELDVDIRDRRATLLHRPRVFRPALDAGAATAHLDEGIGLLTSGHDVEALTAFDRCLAQNPYVTAAHAHRARILAANGATEQALESAVRATDLEPTNAEYRALVSNLARDMGRYELTWAHAIRAVQTGETAADILDALAAESRPPSDLEQQLAAPRVVVLATPPAQPDLLVRAALPGAITAIQHALSRHPAVALVADPYLSQYVAWVSEKELSDKRPRRFEGRLLVNDRAGDELYEEDFELADIDDPAASARDLARHIREIVERIRDRAR